MYLMKTTLLKMSRVAEMVCASFCAISIFLVNVVSSDMVPLKVVNELPSNGYSNLNGLDSKSETSLQLRMKPANFSGPDHLQSLIGRCFKYRDTKYEYVLCPYQNITQEDIQAYYEPYRGVLGIWLDWVIEDNKFVAWNMVEGNSCGTGRHRSTKVVLKCGPSSELQSVTEPEKCRYLAEFQTPEVCGNNAMVVYPRLDRALQGLWDEALTDKLNGDLTEKGYTKEVERIFGVAGLQLSPKIKASLLDQAKVPTGNTKSCNARLEEANVHIVELEEELRMKADLIYELREGKEL